eukprot:9524362-Ditylum_brightwellii.AAC.1
MLKEELVNKLQPLVAGCPSKEELMNATKYLLLNWECEISGIAGQSEESLGEQMLVLSSLKEKWISTEGDRGSTFEYEGDKKVDVINIDESGIESAQSLSTLDCVM